MSTAELVRKIEQIPVTQTVTVPSDLWKQIVKQLRDLNRIEELRRRSEAMQAGDYITLERFEQEMGLA